jgi:hypothetical protein
MRSGRSKKSWVLALVLILFIMDMEFFAIVLGFIYFASL